MRTVGIVAEYNPFHTGHEYHLKKAKETANADFAVVVMSPDFVQRGEPAIFDKYTRTRMALLGGADLVLELPVCYATGSAEYFAEGAVALLDGLGVVDALCFGSETPDPALYDQVSGLLLEEPDGYTSRLRELLRQGNTFPQARNTALAQYASSLPQNFLTTPNNILGVEYCKAIKKLRSAMVPLPVLRKGNGYHSSSLDGEYCSASALRQAVRNASPEQQLSYLPANCRSLYLEACGHSLDADDFLPYLVQPLLARTGYSDILDLSEELSKRLKGLRFSCVGKSFPEITALLKTRQITEARVRRGLLHLILNIRKEDVEAFRANQRIFYARVLGFRAEAAPLLHVVKGNGALPLLTKNASADRMLGEPGKRMLSLDFYSSHLYRSVLACKYGMPFRTEYEYSPIRL